MSNSSCIELFNLPTLQCCQHSASRLNLVTLMMGNSQENCAYVMHPFFTYSELARFSFHYNCNQTVPGSNKSPLSTEINLNYHSRTRIRSTRAVKEMSPPERREGCEEEVAADGTPGPQLRVHEAGRSQCLRGSCRNPFRDICPPTCLPV
jgi:hypothetical protein